MNQLIMNLRVKQHRNMMKRSKIRRGVLPSIQPIVLFREKIKKSVNYRDKSFYYLKLMIVDPPQKLESEESNSITSSFSISRVK